MHESEHQTIFVTLPLELLRTELSANLLNLFGKNIHILLKYTHIIHFLFRCLHSYVHVLICKSFILQSS